MASSSTASSPELFAGKEEDSPLKAIDFVLSVYFEPGERFTKVVGRWRGDGRHPRTEGSAGGGTRRPAGAERRSALKVFVEMREREEEED